MFRKILVATAAAITLISGTVSANPAGHYVRVGYIEDVDVTENFAVLVTKDRNVWFWESATYQAKNGRKVLPVGAKIVAIIDGNGTRTPKDDTIVDFEIYQR